MVTNHQGWQSYILDAQYFNAGVNVKGMIEHRDWDATRWTTSKPVDWYCYAKWVVQGVSTRNIKKVTEELCGESFSKSTVSEICKELDAPIKQFKERLLPDHYPFIIADAIYLKAQEEHRVKSKALFLAIGINNIGHKKILGFEVYDSERTNTWKDFFEGLKSRGLRGVDMIISDAHSGLVGNGVRRIL